MVPVTKEKRRAHYTVHKSLTTVIPFSLPEPGNLSLSLFVFLPDRVYVLSISGLVDLYPSTHSLSSFVFFLRRLLHHRAGQAQPWPPSRLAQHKPLP